VPCFVGTKETAFIYAVMSAGLVHSVTRSCSAGNMTECSCDTTLRHGGSASEGWHWGGCSDDIHYGMAFSRKFLDVPVKNATGKSGSGLAAMNLHNSEAGRQVCVVSPFGKGSCCSFACVDNMASTCPQLQVRVGPKARTVRTAPEQTCTNSESELVLTN